MAKETRMCSTSTLSWKDIDRVSGVSLTSVVIPCGEIPSEDTSSYSAEISVTATLAYLVGFGLMLESWLDNIVSETPILLYYDSYIFLVFKESDWKSKSFLLP